jgi:RNA polymerase sigma-70 factor, ECF subfamily
VSTPTRWSPRSGADFTSQRRPERRQLVPAAPVPEHELIERASAGDEDAFSTLVAAHAERVYGALRRFGLDPLEAEEVAQEVFLRAWRRPPRFERRARLSTWLYRIAFNEAQRCLARRAPPRVEPLTEREDVVASLPESPQLGPEARALDHEFQRVLELALSKLPADWRAAVVLRDTEGLSTEQAAEVVGIRPGAFKSRLHRGRMQLRVLLAPYLQLADG